MLLLGTPKSDAVALSRAVAFAAQMHLGQVDKADKPYILHVLRVVSFFRSDIKAAIVAAFHDILEDTPATAEDLRLMGYDDEIVEAVIAITRQQKESYMDYIRRLADNPIAKAVKIKDLADNLDLSRLPVILEADLRRQNKYGEALNFLWNR